MTFCPGVPTAVWEGSTPKGSRQSEPCTDPAYTGLLHVFTKPRSAAQAQAQPRSEGTLQVSLPCAVPQPNSRAPLGPGLTSQTCNAALLLSSVRSVSSLKCKQFKGNNFKFPNKIDPDLLKTSSISVFTKMLFSLKYSQRVRGHTSPESPIKYNWRS